MGVHLDPDRLHGWQRRLIDDWLVENGSRCQVALEPVLIRGQFVEFTEFADLTRVGPVPDRAVRRGELRTRRRVTKIRVPFSTHEIFGER